MARTMVRKEPQGDQTPFLRGILTQSLVNAGLSFDDAYSVAQAVRSELKDVTEISSSSLRDRVSGMLERLFGEERSRTYGAKPVEASHIIVHAPTRNEAFSVGAMAHSLEACAIDSSNALNAARKVHAALQASGQKEIGHKPLRRVIYRCLREHCSQQMADRYLSWRRFENSGDPLILLIGGITGSGKSTMATELGYRLDIARTQSTDLIREIIRSYLTLAVAPTLQYSSFEAWRGLPAPVTPGRRKMDNPVVTGFLTQFTTLKPALDAAVARTVQERERLILEGVHVMPTELDLKDAASEGIVLPVMVATMEKQSLRKRLTRRGSENSRRGAERYHDHIDDIWELQSYLLSAADTAGTTIIDNWHVEDTIREILELLSGMIMERFPANPGQMDWDA